MQNDDTFLFIGINISEKLQDHLDSSKSSVKSLFNDNNPEFLQIKIIDNNEFIGKEIKSGTTLENLKNILMNVKTMLKMICPAFQFPENAFVILAIQSIPRNSYY